MLAAVQGAGKKIEIGTIGKEGMAGLPLFLGVNHAPGVYFVQVEGEAWRMPAAAFSEVAHEHPALAAALRRYAQALLVQVSQSSACNRVHSPLERCARWLLMTADRVGGDSFHMTQEFLGQMLGERRSTVSRVASQLQRRGLISYSRGRMAIIDTKRLQDAACDCYAVIRREHDLAMCSETRTTAR
jgi:CRP-like cAMP-binding protein